MPPVTNCRTVLLAEIIRTLRESTRNILGINLTHDERTSQEYDAGYSYRSRRSGARPVCRSIFNTYFTVADAP
jgi:hypothetical protein